MEVIECKVIVGVSDPSCWFGVLHPSSFHFHFCKVRSYLHGHCLCETLLVTQLHSLGGEDVAEK